MWVGFCQWQKGLLSFSWKLFSFHFSGLVMKNLVRSSWEHIALKSARICHLETGWRSPWKSAWCRLSRSMSNSKEYIGIPSHITGRTINSIMFWKLITPKTQTGMMMMMITWWWMIAQRTPSCCSSRSSPYSIEFTGITITWLWTTTTTTTTTPVIYVVIILLPSQSPLHLQYCR